MLHYSTFLLLDSDREDLLKERCVAGRIVRINSYVDTEGER